MASKPVAAPGRVADWLLGACCLALAAIVWFAAQDIPASLLSTIGAGYVPGLLAIVLAGLGALHLLVTATRTRAPAAAATTPPAPGPRRQVGRVIGLAVLLTAFVALLDLGLLSFWPTAIGFVFFSGLLLAGRAPRAWGVAALTAAIGVGITWAVFTQLFTVILP